MRYSTFVTRLVIGMLLARHNPTAGLNDLTQPTNLGVLFDLPSSNIPGSPSQNEKYRLDLMYEDMTRALAKAYSENRDDEAKTRTAAAYRAFLGGMRYQKHPAFEWTKNDYFTIMYGLNFNGGRPPRLETKPILAVDSSFLQFVGVEDEVPGSLGVPAGPDEPRLLLKDTFPMADEFWFFWTREYDHWVFIPKEDYSAIDPDTPLGEQKPFPSYAKEPDNPTFCADTENFAWTVLAKSAQQSVFGELPKTRYVMILCPNFFKRTIPGTNPPRYTRDVIFRRNRRYNQDIPMGTSLDSMRPTWLTWLVEISKLVNRKDATDPNVVQVRSAQGPIALNHLTEDNFVVIEGAKLQSAWQCLAFTMYEDATRIPNMESRESARSPTNQAFFVLTVYLQDGSGEEPQYWATGVRQPLPAQGREAVVQRFRAL